MPDENPAGTSTATSSSIAGSASSKPTAPPPVSELASPASAVGDPAAATEYTRTETVTAVQYVAPDGAAEAGNIGAIQALGLEVDQQEPWDPAAGQNCLLIGYPPAEGELKVRTLLQPGQLVVLRSDANAFEVHNPDEFKEQFTPQQ